MDNCQVAKHASSTDSVTLVGQCRDFGLAIVELCRQFLGYEVAVREIQSVESFVSVTANLVSRRSWSNYYYRNLDKIPGFQQTWRQLSSQAKGIVFSRGWKSNRLIIQYRAPWILDNRLSVVGRFSYRSEQPATVSLTIRLRGQDRFIVTVLFLLSLGGLVVALFGIALLRTWLIVAGLGAMNFLVLVIGGLAVQSQRWRHVQVIQMLMWFEEAADLETQSFKS